MRAYINAQMFLILLLLLACNKVRNSKMPDIVSPITPGNINQGLSKKRNGRKKYSMNLEEATRSEFQYTLFHSLRKTFGLKVDMTTGFSQE